MTGRRALRLALRYVEIPVLLALGAFMLWVRFGNYDQVVQPDTVYFIGTDPYYHFRAVLVSLHNFPAALTFDPMTQYPMGTYTGQFGTLYDQLLAFAILLWHGWSVPDTYTVMQWSAVYPAVLGALTVIPVFYFGKRLGGPAAGYVAALVIALLPGEFLVRSLVGYNDHHVAEALLAVTSLLALSAALDAGRESPFRFTDRATWTRAVLLRPALLGVLGGLVLAAYMDVWPPGVMIVVVAGIALFLQASFDHLARKNLDGLAGAAAVSFLTAALLMALNRSVDSWIVPTASNLQPALSFLAAVGALLLALVAHAWTRRGLPGWAYPLALVGALGAGVLLFRLVQPDAYANVVGGSSWVFGGVGSTTRTIQEVRPACADTETFPSCGTFTHAYGYLHILAFLALLALPVALLRRRKPAEALLFVWAAFMFLAAKNQVRFTYYLAVAVALLCGLVVGWVVDALGLPERVRAWFDATAEARKPAARGRRAMRDGGDMPLRWAALAVVLLLLTVFAAPVNLYAIGRGAQNPCAGYSPAWEYSECIGPGEEVTWRPALLWLRDNSPPLSLDLNEVYPPPEDASQRYDYPPGSYGVLSWWDYGHWIQTMAERAPVANPFQQAAPFASVFFTAQSEATAERLLSNLTGDEARVRYVIIDDASAGGKFGAITTWAATYHERFGGDPFPRYYDAGSIEQGTFNHPLKPGQQVSLGVATSKYADTMMSRLYFDDASGLSHYRLVWEFPQYALFANVVSISGDRVELQDINRIYDYQSPGEFANTTRGTWRLESGREVFPVGGDRFLYDLQAGSQVKIYEHVPGATLTGTASAGSVVRVALELQTNAGRPFTYRAQTVADASGDWSLVVPYATGEIVPPAQGGTNTAVLAKGPYQVTRDGSTVSVPVPDRATLEGLTIEVPS